MEKKTKEEIISIANSIFNDSDIIAKHGTSVANAVSILETGFNFDKTSMMGQKTKDPIKLCSYGWKENKRGDATNVILSVPKTFMMKLNNWTEEEYKNWLEKTIKTGDDSELIMYAVSKEEVTEEIEYIPGFPKLPGLTKRNVPREFIIGFFAFCDNTNYLDFITNPEEALDHLTYVENQYYFNKLTEEEQDKFVEDFKGSRKGHAKT